MSYDTLRGKIALIDERSPGSIREIGFAEKSLFIVDVGGYKKLDPVLQIRQDFDVKQIGLIEKIVEKMLFSPQFRDFICCNFQDYCSKLRESSDFKKYFEPYEERKLEDFSKIREFGLISGRTDKVLPDELPLGLYYSFSQKFRRTLKENFKRGGRELDGIFQTSLDIIGKINGLRLQYESGVMYFDSAAIEKIDNFFLGWQMHSYYEHFVNAVISRAAGKAECFVNPLILVNPSFDSNGYLTGFIELDGLLVRMDDKLFIIECKNSYQLKLEHLRSFHLKDYDLLKDLFDET